MVALILILQQLWIAHADTHGWSYKSAIASAHNSSAHTRRDTQAHTQAHNKHTVIHINTAIQTILYTMGGGIASHVHDAAATRGVDRMRIPLFASSGQTKAAGARHDDSTLFVSSGWQSTKKGNPPMRIATIKVWHAVYINAIQVTPSVCVCVWVRAL